jgi:4-alpha-glucanotransferase
MPAKSQPTIAMRLQFFIRFHTEFGQQLWFKGNAAPLQGSGPNEAIAMQYLNEDFWQLTLEIDSVPADWSDWRYCYFLQTKDGEWVPEAAMDRSLPTLKKGLRDVQLIDTWNHAGEFENAFYTAPFSEVLLPAPSGRSKSKIGKSATHDFRIKAPLLAAYEVPCLLGNTDALSQWNTDEPLLLSRNNGWWSLSIDLSSAHFPIAYKYGVYNTRDKKFVRYETGDNRILYQQSAAHELTVLHDGFIHLPNDSWKGTGLAIPVFSLRSRNSFGVGEFTDIRLLVDWARETGLRLIQLLPVNDTGSTQTWTDSYPYSAISAFALHPLYINLSKVAGKKHEDKIQSLKRKQKLLNELPELDYEEVMRFKIAVLRELYELMSNETFEEEEYREFFTNNQHWLRPYAVFCYLRDKYGTACFEEWKTHSRYDSAEVDKLFLGRSAAKKELLFHCFVQYHLHLQLKDAADYAHKKGIVFKGDIAIGISRNSCDAWVSPDLYNMDEQAGAPPDDFARSGQNWEFPTYNWKQMQEDDYAWWRQRFEQMSCYFDAFRIDHILGFFRIWSIPAHAVQGIMGRFVPCLPVHYVEFGENGIWLDEQRFCQPFINDEILGQVFGDLAQKVRDQFLAGNDQGGYDLLPEFNTQRKVQAYFGNCTDCQEAERLREGLYDLISNVILFKQEGSQGQEFHFRIGMENTLSFRYLIPHVQERLKALYVNYFFERQDDFWKREGMKKLPALKAATNMLICGEDLGMVPDCVPEVMKQLGILSLEIQRMPKQANREFFYPEEAPYLSVITPSTHDMSTVRGWWEEDRARTQQFFNKVLGQWGDAPYFCESWISRAIVMQHLYSPAMWAIFQLQDLLGMSDELRRENPHDERINIPANSRHYWRYRMHIPLEQLIREKDFNRELKEYVENSGRS